MVTSTENTRGAAYTSHGAFAPQGPVQHPLEAVSAVTQQVLRHSQHKFTQVLGANIAEIKAHGKTHYRCTYPTCSHADKLDSKKLAMSHIRRVHPEEKPFKCITWYACLQP